MIIFIADSFRGALSHTANVTSGAKDRLVQLPSADMVT
jgi:hypothetical protein